jgi:hypothetical protein
MVEIAGGKAMLIEVIAEDAEVRDCDCMSVNSVGEFCAMDADVNSGCVPTYVSSANRAAE